MISLVEAQDFQLGAWNVSPSSGTLRRDGQCVRLQPRTMRVLVALVRAEAATVSRDSLMRDAWGRVVSEESVNVCVKELRRALGEGSGVVIATVPKIGYRLSHDSAPARASKRRPYGWLAGAAAVAVLAVAVLGFALRPADWTGAVSAFTTDPGADVSPSFDPTGRFIAFSAKPEGQAAFKIRMRALGATASTLLTDGPDDDLAPAWSPNGQSVAFVRLQGDACRLMIVHVPSGVPREVYRCDREAFFGLGWLRDGSGVLLSERTGVLSPYRLVAIGLDGAHRQLTRPPAGSRGDVLPAASPDGRAIAFSRCTSLAVCDLYVLDLAGGRERRLTRDAAHVRGLVWSDDGRTLFFSSQRDGPSTIWAIRASGGAPVKVSPGLVNVTALTQSHDRIVAQVEHLRTNLFAIDRNGAVAALPDGSSRMDWAPAFAPDGRFAFMSNRSSVPDIWIHPSGAQPSRRAARLGAAIGACPSWSPDGREIAFLAAGQDGSDIAVVAANGGEVRRMTRTPAFRLYPSWSHDGRSIYYSSDPDGRGWRVWRLAAHGATPPEAVTEAGWRLGRESPDGRWFYAVRQQSPGLWRRPISGGTFEPYVAGLQAGDAANWTADGDRLLYVARAGAMIGAPKALRVDKTALVSRSVSTGAERIVAPLPDGALDYFSCFSLAVRPDGAVVFARVLDLQTDLDLVDLKR
jgi:Tol biopolymer transport system component/DNA-binding winged helix-turn-helix (wHTH) protein